MLKMQDIEVNIYAEFRWILKFRSGSKPILLETVAEFMNVP